MGESTQLICPIYGGKVTNRLSLPPRFPHNAPGGGGHIIDRCILIDVTHIFLQSPPFSPK